MRSAPFVLTFRELPSLETKELESDDTKDLRFESWEATDEGVCDVACSGEYGGGSCVSALNESLLLLLA